MGVPGLWPFIRDRFGNISVRRFRRNQKRYTFDYVYLDANGLLHAAAQKVFNYGEYKRKIDPYAKLEMDKKYLKTFEIFFDNILDVSTMIVPVKVLYIAIDGPAPRAKQNQQRERRFVAARDRTKEEESRGVSKFDSNAITPGTEFMHRLSQFMYWKIRQYIQTRGPWRDIKVIYSPPTIQGEGEHKIMDYIRELPLIEKTRSSHCMFGPDGDLLMLTLASHVFRMSLFRADQFQEGWYDLVDMNRVRIGLARELGQWASVKSKTRTEEDVSNDFIFMGFFVGNDFLPKIKMFYKLDQGLQKMFDTYIETSNGGFENHLTKDTKILISGFRKFVNTLSQFEEEYLLNQATTTSPNPLFIDNTLLNHVTKKSLDMEGYRQSYYNKAGIQGKNFDIAFETGITQMCEDYFKNLVWVYRYYVESLPSWEEAYRWHYAPLLTDFSKYLDTLQQEDLLEILSFEKSNAAYPFEQLLSVLPPASKNLLPKHYQSLMTEIDSPLVKAGYYPKTFDIDFEGKRKEYQGIALLPFVDYSIISKAYIERKSKTNVKLYRNTRGKVHYFIWQKEFSSHFKSHYGDIKNCKVKVIPLYNS